MLVGMNLTTATKCSFQGALGFVQGWRMHIHIMFESTKVLMTYIGNHRLLLEIPAGQMLSEFRGEDFSLQVASGKVGIKKPQIDPFVEGSQIM